MKSILTDAEATVATAVADYGAFSKWVALHPKLSATGFVIVAYLLGWATGGFVWRHI